jgi:gamma-glutamyl hercynylcysteine S-oxide synthase
MIPFASYNNHNPMPSSSPFDHLDYKPYAEHSFLESGFNSTNALTRSILNGLRLGQEGVPKSDILNPPLWEFGHLTWFHEFWVQRRGHVSNPSLLSNADYLFNSSDMAHDDRWQIDIPSRNALLEYNSEVMNKTHQLLASSIDVETAYFMQLSIFSSGYAQRSVCLHVANPWLCNAI